MICPYCGKKNPENSQICGYCGGPLVAPAEENIPATPPIEVPILSNQPPTQSAVTHTMAGQPAPNKSAGIFSGNKIWWFVGCFLVVIIIIGCGVFAWGLYQLSARGSID